MSARTILVTGAARGIGAATAAHLRARGDRVIGLDIDAADIVADLSTAQGRAHAIAATVDASEGALDAVIACAGLAIPDGPLMVAVNHFGTVALLEGLRPHLEGRPAPRAVAISSSAILLPLNPALVDLCLAGDEAAATALAGREPEAAYASSKAALTRWLRQAAVRPDWAGKGILLNAVAPGRVFTRMTQPILATQEGRAMLDKATPLAVATHAQPEDIAPLLAFLAGADNRYMVGQTLFADGGSEVLLRGEARY